jgi:molybdopterin/thiamine biosynthesis adenylyltransferase
MSLAGALERTVELVRLDVLPDLDAPQVLNGLGRTRVRILADAATAGTHAGQTALTSTVLAASQTGARVSVELGGDHRSDTQPPLRRGQLDDALCELARNPGQQASESDGIADLAIVFGTVASPPARELIHVSGDSWGCSLREEPGDGFLGTLPFGGLLAGAALGAETLRVSLGNLARATQTRTLPEHRLARGGAITVSLPPLPREGLNLGALDVISAGAITNAALFALLRWPGLRARLRLFDDDVLQESNLNRYTLMLRTQIGAEKARLLATLGTESISIEPVCARFDSATSERLHLAQQVLVGVDHIPSRWLLSSLAPRWMCVAATTHFAAMVSEHEQGGPCAACLHPRDDVQPGEIPTVSFVSQLAGYLQAYRLLCHGYEIASAPPTLAAPFNLAGVRPIASIGLSARADCPVRCEASSTSYPEPRAA